MEEHNGEFIDLNTFQRRLKSFYKHWYEHTTDLWGSSDAVSVACPPSPDDLVRYFKSTAVFLWLFGYEIPEAIMVFTKTHIHILCGQKVASVLESVKKPALESVGVEIVLHGKAKNDDGASLMDDIIRAVRAHAQSKSDGYDCSTVGYIGREEPEGELIGLWAEKLKNSNFNLNDVGNGFSALFAAKSSDEIISIERAAYVTASVMKNFVVSKLQKVIDEKKKILHSTLMKETHKVILEPSKVNCKLKEDNVDVCYPPIFQSGDKFDLMPDAFSNNEVLYYASAGVIICAFGAQYKSYCSNIARTFLIDPDPIQSKAYGVLLKAHEAVIGSLKPGNKLCAAYLAAVSVVEKDAPHMVSCLTKTVGTGIGIEFRESGLTIYAKNDRIVKEGMVFNVSIGFKDLQCKNKVFSLLLADTVIINKGKTDIVTSMSSKALKNVTYPFNEGGEALLRSKHSRHVRKVEKSINTLWRQVVARESKRAERETLVAQEKLQLANNKLNPIRLPDLWICPAFGGQLRNIRGTLVAHANGFRYSTVVFDESVDVMFANIKHAFFQPAENEAISLLHFHLHNHIMVGDQKTKDVQFYVVVMETVLNVGGRKRSAYDPDVLEDEERKRERKNKTNVEFQSFVNRVNDLWGQPQFDGFNMKFDQPLREYGFPGVLHKSSVFIIPTSTCLVKVIETHFFVVTLSEIEIVNLERVVLGRMNFDMTIVFKDFKRDVVRIDSIPSTSLDAIKEWLDTTNIKYYETRLNLNWRRILKTFTDDPKSFINGGGWEFLNLKDSDSESDNSEESDKAYEPSYEPSDMELETESDSEEEGAGSKSLVESKEDMEEID